MFGGTAFSDTIQTPLGVMKGPGDDIQEIHKSDGEITKCV